MAYSQVLDFVSLNTRQIEQLDRSKTVVIITGGILEEHGPYLPSGTDGIFNQALAADLAKFVASKPGWTALNFPLVPLGSGAANEIGGKYSFPGSWFAPNRSTSRSPTGLRFDESLLTIRRVLKRAKAEYAKLQ